MVNRGTEGAEVHRSAAAAHGRASYSAGPHAAHAAHTVSAAAAHAARWNCPAPHAPHGAHAALAAASHGRCR